MSLMRGYKICKCVYESDCHGIEMIKTPSGEEYAIGGTDTKDRFRYCPYCGGEIKVNDTTHFQRFLNYKLNAWGW